MNRSLVLLFTGAVPLLALAAMTARAELLPAFHLDHATANSEAIVHGKLGADGQLQVLEVLKGKVGTSVALEGGAEVYKKLQSIILEKSFEVIVFVDRDSNKRWRVVDYRTIAFHKDRVYLFADDRGRRQEAAFNQTDHLPAVYFTEVRAALAAFQERERLLAMARGPERTQKVLAFVVGLPQERAYFHVWTMARSLERSDSDAILAELKKAKREPARIILLELARLVPLGKDTYEQIGAWSNTKHPPATRRAAFATLAAVDPYRMAGEYGLVLRRADELQLVDVLHQLSSITQNERHVPKHRNVLEGLAFLTGRVRRAHLEGGPQALRAESSALLPTIENYAHPRHVPALLEWAMADNHMTSNQALTTLQIITGLKHTREQRDAWNDWHKKAEPILSREYNLASERDRTAWLEAYAQADSATRRLLLTLWHFEDKVDEAGLVSAARGKLGEGAKIVLADLWKVKRLSPAAKQEVLEHFLKVRLVELPVQNRNSASRELQIVVEPLFPFPEDAWFDNRYSIVIGNNVAPKIDNHSSGTFSIGNRKNTGPFMVGSLGGGNYPGAPTARAILQLGETEPNSGGRLVWTKQWALGPIVLEKRIPESKK